MVTSTLRSTSRLALAGLAILAAACGGSKDNAPESGAISVQVARPRVALGSPVDLTYKFTLAPDAPPLGNRKVFVHFLDADDEQMWTDDHDPPTPTASWKPGQTVEYTRTMFVPVYPYVGQAKIVAGLYDPSSGERVRFSGTERGGRAYEVAQIELLPQTENVFLIYKDGWHSVETAQDNSLVEWQWMRKEATLSFRNPRRDSVLYLQADNPVKSANAATSIEVRIGDQVVAKIPVKADDAPVQRLPLTAAQLGSGDMVELKLVADKTLVPALEPGSGNADSRELGARVFHAFVQPQGS